MASSPDGFGRLDRSQSSSSANRSAWMVPFTIGPMNGLDVCDREVLADLCGSDDRNRVPENGCWSGDGRWIAASVLMGGSRGRFPRPNKKDARVFVGVLVSNSCTIAGFLAIDQCHDLISNDVQPRDRSGWTIRRRGDRTYVYGPKSLRAVHSEDGQWGGERSVQSLDLAFPPYWKQIAEAAGLSDNWSMMVQIFIIGMPV